MQPGYHSQYIDCVTTFKVWGSIAGRSRDYRMAVGPTLTPGNCLPVAFVGGGVA